MTVYLVISLPKILCIHPGGCKKHNFWNTPVHPIKNYISGILRLEPIDWYIYMGPIRGGGGWGVVGGCLDFLGPNLQNFSGTFSRDFKHISGILGSSLVHCHPLWVKWIKGGVCVCCLERVTIRTMQAAGCMDCKLASHRPKLAQCILSNVWMGFYEGRMTE